MALRACAEDAEACPILVALTRARDMTALPGAAMPLALVTWRSPRQGGATRRGPGRFISLRPPAFLCELGGEDFIFQPVSIRTPAL